MSRFAEEQSKDEDQSESRMCNMPDCSLVGTLSENIKGGGPWWCIHHFGNRSTVNYTPEEKRDIRNIAKDYNAGKRNYGAGYLETREEMFARILGTKE